MTAWLDPLRMQLDACACPVRFFFRDDDVGWDDERLWALLDRFARGATPVDLAVIPAMLTGSLTSASGTGGDGRGLRSGLLRRVRAALEPL